MNFANLVKAIVALLILSVGYLYYTRPEMEITADAFIRVANNNGYRIIKKHNNDADTFYTASSKDKSIIINYAGFKNEEKSRQFYEKITKFDEEKHQYTLKREVYIGKPCPEMQSYSYYDDYYKAIYTKNAVIYSKVYKGVQGNLDSVFDSLFIPVKFDGNTIQTMLTSN